MALQEMSVLASVYTDLIGPVNDVLVRTSVLITEVQAMVGKGGGLSGILSCFRLKNMKYKIAVSPALSWVCQTLMIKLY